MPAATATAERQVSTRQRVQLTDKQREAVGLLAGPARQILLFGGSRSGKTRIIVEWLVRACIIFPGLRVLIVRAKRIDAKASVWHETLIAEVLSTYDRRIYEIQLSELNIRFTNGSEIWVDGIQEKERIERILGRGVACVYLNEASQISYSAYSLARTRLSQSIPGWRHKIIADCNPPAPTHWTKRVFIDRVEPKDGGKLRAAQYAALRLNPSDNPHLPADFLESLDDLPEAERARFRDGTWTIPTGSIYAQYLGDDTWTASIPDCERYVVGVDLVTYYAVLVGLQRYDDDGKVRWRVYAVDEISRRGAIASDLDRLMQERWGRYDYHAYIDHNLGEAGTREFADSSLATKGQGSVEAGITHVATVMKRGDFRGHRRCATLRYSLENYRRDDDGQVVKEDDHACDALRMALWSSAYRRRWKAA